MQGPHFYYSESGQKIPLVPSGDSLAIAYNGDVPPKDFAALIKGDPELANFAFSSQLQRRKMVIYKRRQEAKTSIEEFAARLLRSGQIAYTSPIYYVNNVPVVVTDEFVAAFKPEVSRETVEQLNAANGVEIVLDREQELGENTFLLRVKEPGMRGALDMANRYFETGLVKFSQPDFLQVISLDFPFTPNDPLFIHQWHLPRIKAPEAWDITRGAPAVRVAVLDTGIETNHDELRRAGKLAAAQDFFNIPPLNTATPGTGGEEHGTCTTGLIVADGNNSVGVTGVAPGCSLIAVRIFGPGLSVTPDSDTARAINFAVNNGAAVISNSWGGPGMQAVLRQAIENAGTNGRGGKGCVLFFSAGNDAGTVAANRAHARHPRSIAVAAAHDGDRHSFYSNTGPELSICAPSDGTSADRPSWQFRLGSLFQEDGSTRLITTTDRMGPSEGMNAPNAGTAADPLGISTDYTSTFGGTSAACPIAAGVAALMLSINPDLTRQQVKFLLEATADKINANNTDPVGRYQPNGHSQWYGFGRVNAFEAVKAARSSVPNGDFAQRVFVRLRRTTGDRFVSTLVFHAIDARQRRADTASDAFVRSGGDGFLQVKMDSLVGPLTTDVEVDE